MAVFPSPAALAVFLAGALLAVLSRRSVRSGWTGLFSMLCASVLVLMTLMAGGTLQEALAWLLPLLALLIPGPAPDRREEGGDGREL